MLKLLGRLRPSKTEKDSPAQPSPTIQANTLNLLELSKLPQSLGQVRGIKSLLLGKLEKPLRSYLPSGFADVWSTVDDLETFDFCPQFFNGWSLKRIVYHGKRPTALSDIANFTGIEELELDSPRALDMGKYRIQSRLKRVRFKNVTRLPKLDSELLESLEAVGLAALEDWVSQAPLLTRLALEGPAAARLSRISGSLTELSLRGQGDVPAEVWRHPKLRRLFIEGLRLPETPHELAQLSELRSLARRRVELRKVGPLPPGLQILDLSSNLLSTLELSHLPDLEVLRLTNNGLQKSPLVSHPKLRALHLELNYLKDTPTLEMPGLESVSLGGNYVNERARRQSDYLRDPQEDDPKTGYLIWMAGREAEREAERNGMLFGSCHTVWANQREILASQHGIDWKSPAEMNPNVIFD